MLKRKIFYILLTLLISLPTPNALAVSSFVPQPEQEMFIEAKSLDEKALVLRDYLAQHNSPLQYHAQDFIDAASIYEVDWKLVPAIAGVESTFGKAIPGGYNGWGWGVYGDQAIYFSSWREGIFEVTKGLKEHYINQGLTTPFAMNRIYATSPFWGGKVTYFMQDIEKFSKYQSKEAPTGANFEAGASAKLTFNFPRLAFLP